MTGASLRLGPGKYMVEKASLDPKRLETLQVVCIELCAKQLSGELI